jgi:pyruvate/2-oxoglutarate dehydrogenase complex dihydrolipoamide dehydrogenase (E3) component
MKSEQFELVVIGGGPAGVTAALRARELGAKVALVERARMGGTCLNDGCVPTRVLARAARFVRDAEQFADYGLMADKPQLDLQRLLKRVQQTVYRIHEKKQIIYHLNQAGASVFENVGEARFLDEHTFALGDGERRSGGTSLRADKFIVCAGGYARRLVFPGSEYALNQSDVWSLKEVPRSLVLVGGAATGCQLASCFSAFGARVTILEALPRLLSQDDEALSQAMTEAFRRRGIEVIAGIGGLQRIEKQNGDLSLYYAYRDQTQTISAGAVLLAVGWAGNVDGLNLAAANVQSEHGYIVVNDYLQTTAPDIFAAGDITGRIMLVQSAGDEGRAAAENAVLGIGHRETHLIVPHGGFTDPEYGSVGLTEAQARAQEGSVVVVVPYREMDRAVIDDRTEGFCKLIVSKETHRLLGAQVVGEQAVEIIQLVAAGMAAAMRAEQLADLEIAYPTYTAILGLAARQVCRELGVVPLSSQWRALGQLRGAEWERSEA